MNLEDRYQKLSLEELVNILETPEDYRVEAMRVARQELKRRGITQEQIHAAARRRLDLQIEDYLDNFNVINDKLELPTSEILNEEEVKLVFKTCFARWKNENDDMIPDSWLYVLGAGFG